MEAFRGYDNLMFIILNNGVVTKYIAFELLVCWQNASMDFKLIAVLTYHLDDQLIYIMIVPLAYFTDLPIWFTPLSSSTELSHWIVPLPCRPAAPVAHRPGDCTILGPIVFGWGLHDCTIWPPACTRCCVHRCLLQLGPAPPHSPQTRTDETRHTWSSSQVSSEFCEVGTTV